MRQTAPALTGFVIVERTVRAAMLIGTQLHE
jgi:hypothetical protein